MGSPEFSWKLADHPKLPKGKTIAVVVLDGWGEATPDDFNCIHKADTPTMDSLKQGAPERWRLIKAHGTAVGLPTEDDMGNSEVGHNALGAGRIYAQGAKLVDLALASGKIYEGEGFKYIQQCFQNGTLHLIGLLSDGGVHSRLDQLQLLLKGCADHGAKRIRVHILTDGRDVLDGSSVGFVETLENDLAKLRERGVDAQIASGGGRMYVTMDRYENDWEVVKRGWDAQVLGEAPHKFTSALEAVKKLRAEPNANDQYLPPFVIVDENGKPVGPIVDGDAVVTINFRADRMVMPAKALEYEDFDKFDRVRFPKIHYAGMLQYDGELKLPSHYLVSPPEIDRTSGEYLVHNGIRTFACRSRICVKNLPKYITEDRLKEFFSQKGEVTDVKLMRTIDGKSRQFGFIGYRTMQEAEEAIKYFSKSYMDTSRIICEIAYKVGDPDVPRPWSRYSKEKEEKTESGKKASDGNSSISNGSGKGRYSVDKGNGNYDPKLEEFLLVTQSRSKSKRWADDALVALAVDKNVRVGDELNLLKKEGERKSVLSEVDVNVSAHRDNLLQDQTPEKSQNFAQDVVVSDVDYFKSRVKKDWSDSESDVENDDDDIAHNNGNDPVMKMDPDEQYVSIEGVVSQDKGPSGVHDGELTDSGRPSSSLKDATEEVLETGRLFVRNLPYTASEEELEAVFSEFGNVSEVHLVVDKETKRSKGFAYVLYSVAESAARALEELDHSIFQGRLLHVMPAKAKNPSPNQVTNVSGRHVKTFKQQKEEERKASEVGGSTQAWNSLFMRPDTVVENIARKYGVSKSDFLDREADDLAVRIALGETQVITETKTALANAGVNVGSLEEFASGKTEEMKRSNHVLLVKNLPYNSTEGELSMLFGGFGSLDKIVFPSTRTLALVVFLEPAEARAAFRGLAYKRYKDAPLYLEWAPNNILNQDAMTNNDAKSNAIVGEHEVKRVLLEQAVGGMPDVDIDPDRIESRSLFVKNLNFKSTDENLRRHISENMRDGNILSIRIKKHLKNGKNVSMGFGFIEFDSMETAVIVCRDLQGTVLDGHALILQLCHAKKDEKVLNKMGGEQSSTKLIVRNVAFEATEKDLRQLFSPFGQIKSLRLPMRFGNHRGFAFVEYVTKQEAQNALRALSNTHLYGRHLVLERAKEGESLEELRARTAAQFANDDEGFQNPTKISKKRKFMGVSDEAMLSSKRLID